MNDPEIEAKAEQIEAGMCTPVRASGATEPALLPCPFCGGEPQFVCGGPGNWYVRCLACKAASNDLMRHVAIERWNARTSPTPQIAGGVRDALTEWFDNLDWEAMSDEGYRHTAHAEMLAALSPQAQAGEIEELHDIIKAKDAQIFVAEQELERFRHAAQGWQDISTAPKDHLPILAYGPYGALVAFLDATMAWWPVPATDALDYAPTHWMPLPSRPTPSIPSTQLKPAATKHSGTFLGYRDEHGNEMHCAHAFCPHQAKCHKGCINPVALPSTHQNSGAK